MKIGVNVIYETRTFNLSRLRVACLRNSGRYYSIGTMFLDSRGYGESFFILVNSDVYKESP